MVGKHPPGKTALIGQGRACDITVNIALPFLHAYKLIGDDAVGAAAMLKLFRECGPLTENEITRQIADALQEPGWGRVAKTARRQQGLIHLQRILAGQTGG